MWSKTVLCGDVTEVVQRNEIRLKKRRLLNLWRWLNVHTVNCSWIFTASKHEIILHDFLMRPFRDYTMMCHPPLLHMYILYVVFPLCVNTAFHFKIVFNRKLSERVWWMFSRYGGGVTRKYNAYNEIYSDNSAI